MEKKIHLKGTIMAFSSYKPKAGKEDALMKLVDKHLPTLRELELATNRASYIARSSDGRIIEIFEWASADAITAAHRHPAISDIWEKMALVADFLPMNTIPEANQPFASLELIK